jgi:hypothetical protein
MLEEEGSREKCEAFQKSKTVDLEPMLGHDKGSKNFKQMQCVSATKAPGSLSNH